MKTSTSHRAGEEAGDNESGGGKSGTGGATLPPCEERMWQIVG